MELTQEYRVFQARSCFQVGGIQRFRGIGLTFYSVIECNLQLLPGIETQHRSIPPLSEFGTHVFKYFPCFRMVENHFSESLALIIEKSPTISQCKTCLLAGIGNSRPDSRENSAS